MLMGNKSNPSRKVTAIKIHKKKLERERSTYMFDEKRESSIELINRKKKGQF